MIEKYFLPGVKFKWPTPLEQTVGNKDGSIIDNLQRPSGLMIYDGMDSQLYNPGRVTHVSYVGLLSRQGVPLVVPYKWLAYSAGHTTRLSTGGDILTGFMGGCLITVWTDQGRRYVGHVGTVIGNKTVNDQVQKTFADTMPQNTTGFNPAKAWPPGEIAPIYMKIKPPPQMEIMALVTSGNEFYSILMFHMPSLGVGPTKTSADRWCVGGIKRVPPMNYQALRLKFLGPILGV